MSATLREVENRRNGLESDVSRLDELFNGSKNDDLPPENETPDDLSPIPTSSSVTPLEQKIPGTQKTADAMDGRDGGPALSASVIPNQPAVLPPQGSCSAKGSVAIGKRDPKRFPRNGDGGPKIVGGRKSEHAWTVAITMTGTSATHYCSGSLIAPQWVLTAAQCQVQPGDLAIVGRKDLASAEGKVVKVALTRNHPSFDSKTMENDVALLKLDKVVTEVKPISLFDGSDLSGAAAIVAGWGFVKEGGAPYGGLLEMGVPIVTNAVCSAGPASVKIAVTGNMLCASRAAGDKQGCQGDSGGPLIVKVGEAWQQAGIVSFGVGCAPPNGYAVFTRVSKYLPWVRACTQ
jgi:hypothetical protein